MSIEKYKTTKGTRYRVRLRLYDNGELVKNYKKAGFERLKDAKEHEAYIISLDDTEANKFKNITFNEILDHYLKVYKSRNKYRSYYTITNKIKVHISPYFDSKKIYNISAKDITDWQVELKNKGYSIKYLQSIHILLSSIFIHAKKYFRVTENPCSIVGNFKNTENKEMNYYTVDEFNNFLKLIDDLRDYVLFYTLFWTGMRKGELLALRWQDIDLNKKVIKISKTLNRYGINHKWELTSPKTKGSKREILLIDNLNNLLKNLLEENKKIIGFNMDFFVFRDIEPLHPSTLDRIYTKYANRFEKRIRIHDFRHSFASALINLGADIFLLAKMLGHTNPEQIYKTYGHLYPNKQKELIEKINNYAFSVPFSNSDNKKAL